MPTSLASRKAVSREPISEVFVEPPESLARGTLSEGFPTSVGDLLVSAVAGGTVWSRETEDCRDGRGGVLEARSTDEGGELAQPEPTGGKGWTSGRPDWGIHGDTPRSSNHVHRTESVIRTGQGRQDDAISLDWPPTHASRVDGSLGKSAERRERGRGRGHVPGVRAGRVAEHPDALPSPGE